MNSITERSALPADVITRQAKTNFYYSFLFLPKQKREAIEVVYAFCRLMDDIVDDEYEVENPAIELIKWRREVSECFRGTPNTTLGKKLQQVVKLFPIPETYFQELITGMEFDLEKQRYETFDQLERYCYHVAGVTGLMCIEIFGYRDKSAQEYAKNLGNALQLVNIIRDLKEDALRERVYLPQEELKKFGYSEQDLFNSVYNSNFVNLMKFQAERAHSFFHRAQELLSPLDRSGMFAAEIMARIYFKILQKIETANFDVFNNSFKLSKFEKASAAIKGYVSSRF